MITQSAPRPLASRLAPLLPTLLLFALTVAVYARVFGHDFTGGDDELYVTSNEAIQGVSWQNLKAAFTSFYVANYAPVQIISYMLDYTLWGLRAPGFLFTNLVLHAANGALYLRLLQLLSPARVWPWLAALLFLLHPVQVESVAWVSQRKNLLAMSFFLLALHLYRRYRQNGKRPRLCYALALIAFILALLAKSVVVILPLVLILYDLCYGPRRPWRPLLLDKLPFLAAAGAVAFLTMVSQSADYGAGRAEAYPGGTLFTAILTMLPVLARYLGILFWPSDLSVWYSPPVKTGIDAAVACSGLLFIGLLLLGGWLYRRRRELCFWYALFFIGLLPVSQLVPLVTLMNDRYLYFPMLGAAAFLASLLFARTDLPDLRRPNRHLALALCTAGALALLAMATAQRTAVWRDSLSVWQDAVAHAPAEAVPYYNLGVALMGGGRTAEAIGYLEMANRLEPNQGDTLNMLGIAAAEQGNLPEAIARFEQALAIDPNDERAALNLANVKELQRAAGRP